MRVERRKVTADANRRLIIALFVVTAVFMTGVWWKAEYNSCLRTNVMTESINETLAGFDQKRRFNELECSQPIPDTQPETRYAR